MDYGIVRKLAAPAALLLLLCLAACGPDKPEGYSVYQDENNGFSIAHPSEWEILHGMGTLVSFAAPGKRAQGRPNFGVTTETLNATLSPEQYLAGAKQVMRNVIPGFELLDEQTETIAGREAIRFRYRIELEGQKLSLVGFAVVAEQQAYVVTGGCKQANFPEYEHIFDAAGRSLTIAGDRNAFERALDSVAGFLGLN